MKRVFFFLTILAVFILPQAVFAVVNANANMGDMVNSYKGAQNLEQRLERLQDLGKSMIEKRLQDLQHAEDLLNQATHISQATKDELATVINDNQSKLTELEGDIAVEDDITACKDLVHAIIQDYRVYIVVLPQIHGMAVADKLSGFADKLDELKAKAQEKTNELKNDGKNVETIETLITEAGSAITAARTDIDEAQAKFESMSIPEWEQSITLRQQGRQELVSARQNLNNARQSLMNAVNAIKTLASE